MKAWVMHAECYSFRKLIFKQRFSVDQKYLELYKCIAYFQ